MTDEDYYHEARAAGLDYLACGDWQARYGRWLVEALSLSGKLVLDVGCAAGSTTRGISNAGAYASGCDKNEWLIARGRQKTSVDLRICDACNLHYWGSESFHLVHCHNLFMELRPERVGLVLGELFRVTKPGGILFAVIGDCPTLPPEWWEDALDESGWIPDGVSLAALEEHPESFFGHQDWDVIVSRRGGIHELDDSK